MVGCPGTCAEAITNSSTLKSLDGSLVKHPSKEIPIGTLRNIYRQANWKWEDRLRCDTQL